MRNEGEKESMSKLPSHPVSYTVRRKEICKKAKEKNLRGKCVKEKWDNFLVVVHCITWALFARGRRRFPLRETETL